MFQLKHYNGFFCVILRFLRLQNIDEHLDGHLWSQNREGCPTKRQFFTLVAFPVSLFLWCAVKLAFVSCNSFYTHFGFCPKLFLWVSYRMELCNES